MKIKSFLKRALTWTSEKNNLNNFVFFYYYLFHKEPRGNRSPERIVSQEGKQES